MTLCLAAECRNAQTVIIAHDWSAETETSRAGKMQNKFLPLYNRIPVLIAGTASRGMELGAVLLDCLKDAESCANSNDSLSRLREAVKIQKQALANEYTGATIGRDYNWFLNNAKTELPADVWRKMAMEIADIDLGCDIIVVLPWIYERRLQIFRVWASGTVEACSIFAAIGTGREMAESMLFYREYRNSHALPMALYKFQEALRFGQHAPSVSEHFSMSIVTLRRRKLEYEVLTSFGCRYLNSCVQDYGPQRIAKIRLEKEWIKKQP